MATKRPAETTEQSGNKKAKTAMAQQGWSEAQETLDLLGKQFQQKQIEFESHQKQLAAEAVQDQETIAVQGEKIKNLESQLNIVIDLSNEVRKQREEQESATNRKIAEIERSHAATTRDLESQLTKAKASNEGEHDRVDSILKEEQGRVDVIFNLDSALKNVRAREASLEKRLEEQNSKARGLRSTIEAYAFRTRHEEDRRREMTTRIQALCKQRDDAVDLANSHERQKHSKSKTIRTLSADIETAQSQLSEMVRAYNDGVRENDVLAQKIDDASVHADKLEEALEDRVEEVRGLKRARAVLKSQHVNELQSMSQALDAADKVRIASKGIPVKTLGEFGMALGELRNTLTPKVRSLVKEHSPDSGCLWR